MKDLWDRDDRRVTAARLDSYVPAGADGIMLAIDGWEFERFERSGEMAMIPYLRASRGKATVEAPLGQWAWVEFGRD